MQFRVLGSLEVVGDDERVVTLVSPRQRRLLAGLLLHAGAVVSGDSLVDIVWGSEESPAGGVRTLRTVVSRLRASLEDDRDGVAPRIITRPPGYVLELDGSRFDAPEFETQVSAGQTLLADGDASGAVAVFEEALRLWRGEAYAEFSDEEWARAEAVRLEELRAVARMARVDGRLAMGAHAEVVAEAERLVADYPYRERPRAQLMTALYGSGRQADALRAYQSFRQVMVDELGLEPSAELQALERQIVAQDPSLAAEPPGRRLKAYRLIELIGKGSTGEVWRTNQASTGRDVALKLIRPELANDADFIRRFEVEAQLIASLEHPHIVPLYDYWRDPSGAFLVMRMLRGGSAADRLRCQGPWPLGAVAALVEQAGGALSVAHRAGVIHRDVKPSNVLLDDDGNAYLADFGVAVQAGSSVDDPSAGSPAYAAPEQLRRMSLDHTVDVFALAVTAWELLCGRLPYQAQTITTLLVARDDDPLPSVRVFRPDLPAELDEPLRRATAVQPSQRYQQVMAFVEAFRTATMATPAPGFPGVRRLTETVVPRRDTPNPYKGLRPFGVGDTEDFYGRDHLVEQLADGLTAHRFVAAVGPSGAGKSSLVRAGLLPALRQGRLPGSASWFTVTMLPGANPFEELEAALLHIAVNPPASLLEQLDSGGTGISRAIKRTLPEDGATLLVVIDQFEELFTQSDPAVAGRFIAGLTAAVADPHTPIRVVVTLRADFYDRPLNDHRLADLLTAATVPVGAMSPDELEAAITRPAQRVDVSVESPLVAELVAQATGQPAALPLLQYVLTELFAHRAGQVLTMASYRELGGLSGAIAQRAESIYLGLDDPAREAARVLFGRLVTLGEGTADTRRRTLRRDLEAGEHGHETATVIEAFGQGRLLAFDRDPSTRQATVEIAHEALLIQWPRLRRWIVDDRDTLHGLSAVAAGALTWDGSGRQPADLLRGARLQAALELEDAHHDRLTPVERQFVGESHRQLTAEQARHRRQNRRLTGLLAGAAVFLVAALVAGLFAFQQRNQADRRASEADVARSDADQQRDQAKAEALDADVARLGAESLLEVGTDRSRALLLAAEAYRLQPTLEHAGWVQRVLLRLPRGWLGAVTTPGSAVGAQFVPGRKELVVAGADGVEVVDLGSRATVGALDVPGSITALAVGTDRAVVGTRSGQVHVFSTATWEPRATFAAGANGDQVKAVALSPDGTSVALGLGTGRLAVRSADGAGPGVAVDYWPGRPVTSVTWNPAGTRVLVTGGRDVPARQFDAFTGAQVGADMGETVYEESGAGRARYAGGRIVVWNGNIREFDADTGAPIGTPSTPGDASGGPALDLVVESSQTLLGVGALNLLERFDPARDEVSTVIEVGGDALVTSLAVDEDTGVVAIARGEGVDLWSLTGQRALGAAVPSQGNQAMITGDGIVVATAGPTVGEPGTTAVWTVADRPRLLHDFPDGWNFVDVGGGGRFMLARPFLSPDPNGQAEWIVYDPARDVVEQSVVTGLGVADELSADGRWFAVGRSNDTVVEIYDLREGTKRELFDLQESLPPDAEAVDRLVGGLRFTPDSRYLIGSNLGSNVVIRWDTATWRPSGPPLEDDLAFTAIDFSQDGSKAIAWRTDGILQYRDPATLAPLGEQARTGPAAAGGHVLTLSADGRSVATSTSKASGRGGVQVWDAETLTPIGDPFPSEGNQGYPGNYAAVGEKVAAISGPDAMVWDANPDHWVDLACRTAGRNLSADEWARYGPKSRTLQMTCPVR
jgi:serine/threonine protein kinase/WD40 repeat protein/DNA-binding winged helix-turn-helix (wHTH) protein